MSEQHKDDAAVEKASTDVIEEVPSSTAPVDPSQSNPTPAGSGHPASQIEPQKTAPVIADKPAKNETTQIPQIAGGQTFADFMYAVVIGVAFSDVKLSDSKPALFATLVILVMILEDFYMYQTQVKPLVSVFQFWTLRSLAFEMGLLLSWFLAFLARKESLASAIVCIGVFYFLKWLASALRIRRTEKSKRWVLHRDHFYLMTILSAGVLAIVYDNFLGAYLILSAVWTAQTALWWVVVRIYERRAAATA